MRHNLGLESKLDIDRSSGFASVTQTMAAVKVSASPISPAEAIRRRILFDPTSTVDQITKQFKKGQEGSLVAIAHYILWKTENWVYGGYIRDWLIRGNVHDEMDLDIGLPLNGHSSPQQALNSVKKI